jgi:hypothetical protein
MKTKYTGKQTYILKLYPHIPKRCHHSLGRA